MKTYNKITTKRRLRTHLRVFNSLDLKMGDKPDNKKQKCLTDDPAAKVVSVELNKNLKAKENEQDAIPSDDEDGYPDLGLKPEEIAKRKQLAKQKLHDDKNKGTA